MKDRITVVKQIYHQQAELDPTLEDCRYETILKTEDEQPYQRVRLPVGEEWQSLIPKGSWLDRIGLIVIKNLKEIRETNPTEEEAQAIADRVLQIRYMDSQHYWSVPPDAVQDFYPSDYQSLLIRCQRGRTRYNVTLYPE